MTFRNVHVSKYFWGHCSSLDTGLFCNRQICNGYDLLGEGKTSGMFSSSLSRYTWLSWKVSVFQYIVSVQTASEVIAQGLTCSRRVSVFRMKIGHQSFGTRPTSQSFIRLRDPGKTVAKTSAQDLFFVVRCCAVLN